MGETPSSILLGLYAEVELLDQRAIPVLIF